MSGRNALAWEERFALDVQYVDNVSFLGDLSISGKNCSGRIATRKELVLNLALQWKRSNQRVMLLNEGSRSIGAFEHCAEAIRFGKVGHHRGWGFR